MEESTNQNVSLIKAKIEDDMNSIKTLALSMKNQSLDDVDSVLDRLNKITKVGHFKKLGIVYANGDCFIEDNKAVNIR